MKVRSCDKAKEHEVHREHVWESEHGSRVCKGWHPTLRPRPMRLRGDE